MAQSLAMMTARPTPNDTADWVEIGTDNPALLEKNLATLRALRENYRRLFARGHISWPDVAPKLRDYDILIAEGEYRLDRLAFTGARFRVEKFALAREVMWRVLDGRRRSIVCERASLAEANKVAEGLEREHAEVPSRWARLVAWLRVWK